VKDGSGLPGEGSSCGSGEVGAGEVEPAAAQKGEEDVRFAPGDRGEGEAGPVPILPPRHTLAGGKKVGAGHDTLLVLRADGSPRGEWIGESANHNFSLMQVLKPVPGSIWFRVYDS